MYWYVKYPLYLIGLLLIIGVGYLLWDHVPAAVATRLNQILPFDRNVMTTKSPPAVAAPPAPTQIEQTQPAEVVAATAPSGENRIAAETVRASLQILEQRLAAAEEQIKKDNILAAKAMAEKVLETPGLHEFEPKWLRTVEILNQANTILINTDAPAPEKIRYIIQPGDTLIGVANKFQTTVAAIERGNKLDVTRMNLYPGMVLNIYSGKWAVSVYKTRFVLILYDGTKIFKYYRVGIGRQNRTPVGVFKIVSKLREPVWTPPGKVIPFGDPENVLGTRWMGLQPLEGTDQSLKGYGIHGTWQPETIGSAASEGCVRMKNDEVNELFDIVPMGTPVTIRDE